MAIKCDTKYNNRRISDNLFTTLKRNASRLLKKLYAYQKAKQKQHKDRVALKELYNLSDKNLRDIGISRADIIWASKLPSEQSATYELQKIAKSRTK